MQAVIREMRLLPVLRRMPLLFQGPDHEFLSQVDWPYEAHTRLRSRPLTSFGSGMWHQYGVLA